MSNQKSFHDIEFQLWWCKKRSSATESDKWVEIAEKIMLRSVKTELISGRLKK